MIRIAPSRRPSPVCDLAYRVLIMLSAAFAVACWPAAGHAADPGPYVALGDSYTAAPLIPFPGDGPPFCLRSTSNYPSIVARTLPASRYRDVSCSGASTDDMSRRQPYSENDPQLDALGAETRLVTLGLGFNDAKIGQILTGCPLRGLLQPSGTACRDFFTAGGQDAQAQAITDTAPKFATVLREIHERAPRARVIVLGYPSIVPNDGRSCFLLAPLSPDDLRYFDELLVKLNAMLATAAAGHDAEYADSYFSSIGHDVCTAPGTKWWEGAIPTAPAYPWHPNALGEQHLARTILKVLARPRPAPVLSALAAVSPRIRPGTKPRLSFELNRAATVTIVFRRQVKGRLQGGRCRPASAANRRGRSCERRSRVLRTVRVQGSPGINRLTVSASRLTTPGLYRVTATATGDERAGMPQTTSFRVTRAR